MGTRAVAGVRRHVARGLVLIVAGALALAALPVLVGTAAANDHFPGCTGGVGDVAALRDAFGTANRQLGGTADIYLVAGCTYTLPNAMPDPNGDYEEEEQNGLPPFGADNGAQVVVHGNGATITRGAGAGRIRMWTVFIGATATIENLTITDFQSPHGIGPEGD